ncbi:MAG: MFS transporter [Pseudomonadota bacterium]
MSVIPLQKRVRGWMAFDWASQPYNTLLLTFVFGPYFAEIVSDIYMSEGMLETSADAQAQSVWGIGQAVIGLFIAISAPVLGAMADNMGRRLPYIWVFSALYVVGAAGLWFAHPESFNITLVLVLFGIGFIGMEFATTFTNAMLPDLGPPEATGKISGIGWAVGYLGGLVSLVIMLLFFAENSAGTTLLGISPLFGLDPEAREGTRLVGPFAALWYIVFMVPFFLWVRDGPAVEERVAGGASKALSELRNTLSKLPRTPSLSAFLGASMIYRDGLNGLYAFGGVYAKLVLDWSVIDIGIFGILAVVTGAVFAWLGGLADEKIGSKRVVVVSILALICATVGIASIAPSEVLWIDIGEAPVLAGKSGADIAFYVCGAIIGAAGGTVQAASRALLVKQANPQRLTEAFGLYSLAGKATAFLAPASIALVTSLTDSQRIGVTPLIGLFLLGLVLLIWVKPEGEDDAVWASEN